MKQSIFSILLSTVLSTVFSQVQNGLVREQNSQKKPIPDAQIIFSDAVPTTSEQSGKFRLVFSGKKAGDLIFYKEITKIGYEIVNLRELEVLKISNTNKIGVDVILAKAGVLDAAKKEYYNISDRALLASFIKEKDKLREKLAKTKLNQQAYLDKYTVLTKQYEEQQKALDVLAEAFARTNFDDVSEVYKVAFNLFKNGKIDQALKLLESTDLLNRTKYRIKEKKRIEMAEIIVAQQKIQNENGVKEDLQGLQLQAQLYVLTFQIDKAEKIYDRVLLLDSTDLEILRMCSEFYRKNHYYKKAIPLFLKIIVHSEAEDWQKGNAHGFLGELYTTIGDLNEASKDYVKCFEIYSTLCKKDTLSAFYQKNLAISYQYLGTTYTTMGNLDTALHYYMYYYQIAKELFEDYPENIDFKNGLAISFSKMGETYFKLNEIEMAITFFKNYNRLRTELNETNPNNIAYRNGLAISYQYLGASYNELGSLDTALHFFEKDLKLTKKLCDDYPNNVSFKKGLAISYQFLATTYTALNILDSAFTAFEITNRIFTELCQSFPNNVEFQNGLAMSYANLGIFCRDNRKDKTKARSYFKQAEALFKNLVRDAPQFGQFQKFLDSVQKKLRDLD